MVTRVGVVGAGTIGTQVVRSLTADTQYVVFVCDLSRAAASEAVKLGATWRGSPVELVQDVDVLITALPAPRHVRAVMEEAGTLRAMRRGQLWIDHTSTDPDEPRRLAGVCNELGIRYLEAPLTGGVALLKQNQMTVYMSGEPSVIDAAMPIVRHYTATQLPMGTHGTAAVAKIISNMLCACHTVITGEALMMAKKAGVDLRSFFDAIRMSAGNSFVWETEAPLVFNGSFHPDFSLALHCKDLGIGYDIARRHGAPIEVLALVQQIYHRAMYKYGNDAGSSHPAKLLQDELNEALQVPGFEKWTYNVEKVTGGGIGVVHEGVRERSRL